MEHDEEFPVPLPFDPTERRNLVDDLLRDGILAPESARAILEGILEVPS